MTGGVGGFGELVVGVAGGLGGVAQAGEVGAGQRAGGGAFADAGAHQVAGRAQQVRAVGDDGDVFTSPRIRDVISFSVEKPGSSNDAFTSNSNATNTTMTLPNAVAAR